MTQVCFWSSDIRFLRVVFFFLADLKRTWLKSGSSYLLLFVFTPCLTLFRAEQQVLQKKKRPNINHSDWTRHVQDTGFPLQLLNQHADTSHLSCLSLVLTPWKDYTHHCSLIWCLSICYSVFNGEVDWANSLWTLTVVWLPAGKHRHQHIYLLHFIQENWENDFIQWYQLRGEKQICSLPPAWRTTCCRSINTRCKSGIMKLEQFPFV